MSATVSTRWSSLAIFISGLRGGNGSAELRSGGALRGSGETGDRLRLFLDLQRVVELVEKAAQRDAQGQLDDLRLAETRPQAIEQRVRDAVRVLPGGDRIFDDEPVGVVEFGMIAVVEQTRGA